MALSNITWLFLFSLYSGNSFCGLPRSLCLYLCFPGLTTWLGSRHPLYYVLLALWFTGLWSLPSVLSLFTRFDDLWVIKFVQYSPGVENADILIHYVCLSLWFKGKWKWNESGFRPPLCTYRLNWARRTSWGWWDDWDDTVLQTQDSKFEPWRSEAEHATSRSRRLPTILTFTRGWGRNNFVSFKPPRPGTEPRTLAWKAAVLTTTLGPPPSDLKDSWSTLVI